MWETQCRLGPPASPTRVCPFDPWGLGLGASGGPIPSPRSPSGLRGALAARGPPEAWGLSQGSMGEAGVLPGGWPGPPPALTPRPGRTAWPVGRQESQPPGTRVDRRPAGALRHSGEPRRPCPWPSRLARLAPAAGCTGLCVGRAPRPPAGRPGPGSVPSQTIRLAEWGIVHLKLRAGFAIFLRIRSSRGASHRTARPGWRGPHHVGPRGAGRGGR